MAYEKQTWKTGEVITEEKLNHMEEGIANGKMLVTVSFDGNKTYTADKTWNEIKNALRQGAFVYQHVESDNDGVAFQVHVVEALAPTSYNANGYRVNLSIDTVSPEVSFRSDTPDGVLTYIQEKK